MTEKQTGGPAFPVGEEALMRNMTGVTIRDYFAAKALQGLLADSEMRQMPKEFAKASYEMADAMLKVRDE